MSKNILKTTSLLALVVSALPMLACDGGQDTVMGSANVKPERQGLQIGNVMAVRGLYEDGKCLDPATGTPRMGAAWQAAISPMAGSEPVVALRDPTCVLDIAALDVLDSAGATQQAVPGAPIPLAGSFWGMPAQFSYTDSGSGQLIKFFVNANLAPADFRSNFDISVVYSDHLDPVTATTLNGQYATVVSNSVVDSRVAQPANMLSFAGVTYEKDGSHLATNIAGSVTFTRGNPAGTGYSVIAGACPSTLAATDSAYQGASHFMLSDDPTLASFGLTDGADLSAPVQNCMIIANCDQTSGVCSYQNFEVTFN